MTARRAAIASCSPGRRVPTATTAIGTAKRVLAAFDVTGELARERGPVSSETVPAVRAA